MQIIETRNDILKLAYSPFQNGLLLSDFLLVSEGSKSILTQVIGIESSKEKDINIAILKGCLSVDETGKVNSYIGFTPSTGAEVAPVSQEHVINMLCSEGDTVLWGYLAQHDNILFKTEKTLLANKPLILMDDYENYNVILNNIAFINNKSGKKLVIVDFDGSAKIDNAFYVKIGEDLKIPLSFNTLNYIYDNDLKLESLSTQAVVQDIINELQEYIKTLPEGYLPFSTIKNVIYAQYEENKIPELMLFKNKFVKYAQQELFAESTEDFDFLNKAIRDNDLIVIDASNIEIIWHKLVLDYLSKNINEQCFFLTKLENDNSNKKSILDIYNNHSLSPILTASYTHEFVNVLKSIAKNMILFPPKQLVNDFATYSSFIHKLNRDEYVICGENTLYLSFLLRLTYIDTNMSPDYIEKEIQQDVDKLYRSGASKTKSTIEAEENILEQKSTLSQAQYANHTKTSDEEENVPLSLDEFDDITEEDLDFFDELEQNPNSEYIEYTAPPSENSNEAASAVTPEPSIQNDQAAEQGVMSQELSLKPAGVEDIEESEQSPQDEENYQPIIDESIDDYSYKEQSENSSVEDIIQPEEKEKEPNKPTHQTPPIPVYSVPELEVETPVEFTEGNFVFHEKYGKGVIEKIMNYGNKTLCSIQFEEVGRRLLDPNLAGLKQV